VSKKKAEKKPPRPVATGRTKGGKLRFRLAGDTEWRVWDMAKGEFEDRKGRPGVWDA
jgi:hypothetical protein